MAAVRHEYLRQGSAPAPRPLAVIRTGPAIGHQRIRLSGRQSRRARPGIPRYVARHSGVFALRHRWRAIRLDGCRSGAYRQDLGLDGCAEPAGRSNVRVAEPGLAAGANREPPQEITVCSPETFLWLACIGPTAVYLLNMKD